MKQMKPKLIQRRDLLHPDVWVWQVVLGVGVITLGTVATVDAYAAIQRAKDAMNGGKCFVCRGTRKMEHAKTPCLRCCRVASR